LREAGSATAKVSLTVKIVETLSRKHDARRYREFAGVSLAKNLSTKSNIAREQ
jgi:hypothetical protein